MVRHAIIGLTQTIVITVGLPGSGKSTSLKHLGIVPLSSDLMRLLLADDPTDQSLHYRVFVTIRYLLRQRLALSRPVTYVDATNLTPSERRPYVRIARLYGCAIEALYFDVPLETCRERNRRRRRIVPEEALERMAAKFTPPSIEEGFRRILTIGPDGVARETPG